jgi:hypothetical protein
VFFQLTQICLFGAHKVCLHLETPNLQEIILSKLTQFSQGNNELGAPASNTHDFLQEILMSLQLT